MNKKSIIIDKYSTVYSWNIYVIANPNKVEIDKHFEWKVDHSTIYDETVQKLTAVACAWVWDKDNNTQCMVVILNSLKDEEYNINTFSHEAFHVTMDILDSCNIKYSEDSNEAYAYMVGYVTECIYKTAKKV